MVALMKVYEEEDKAYQDLVTMATQFYQYLLQPFRDMRELATLYRLEILVGLPLQNKRPGYIVGHQLPLEQFGLKLLSVLCFLLYVFPANQATKCNVKNPLRAEPLSEDLRIKVLA